MEDALATGIDEGRLTLAEAVVEERVLPHFAGSTDALIEAGRRGVGLEDSQGRVYRHALALRPLVRAALEQDGQGAPLTFEPLLAHALDVWQALVELELACRFMNGPD